MPDHREYFDKQQPEHRQVLYCLHSYLERAAVGVTCKLIWGQPFYYYKGTWFGYLSYVKKWKSVELGFPRGKYLDDPEGLLLNRGRKMVWSIAFHTLDDVHRREDAILEMIQRAIMLNENTTT